MPFLYIPVPSRALISAEKVFFFALCSNQQGPPHYVNQGNQRFLVDESKSWGNPGCAFSQAQVCARG